MDGPLPPDAKMAQLIRRLNELIAEAQHVLGAVQRVNLGKKGETRNNVDERESYQRALEAAKFEVIVGIDPLDAVRVAVSRRPDAIVTRIFQPNSSIDGVELIRRLKADSRTAHMGIIITMSLREAHYSGEAQAAGCDECLLLPASANDVADAVRRVLKRRSEWHQQSA